MRGYVQNMPKSFGTDGGTSRRGARALYHDDDPRDFGPKVAYEELTFRIPVGRQGGREMSARGPYETNPFSFRLALYPCSTNHSVNDFHIYLKMESTALP